MVSALPAVSAKQKALVCVYAAVLMDMLGSALTVPIMPFYVTDLGGTPRVLGAMFGTFAAFQVVASLWMGWASDKFGRRPILLISLSGSGLGMLASAAAPGVGVLFAARAFLGFFSGSTSTANAYVAEIVPPSDRARLMALIGAMSGLAFMFGPPIGSALGEFGLRIPFYVGGFTSLIAVLIAYFYLLSPAKLEKLSGVRPKERWRKLKDEGAIAAAVRAMRASMAAKAPLASQDEKAPSPAPEASGKGSNWKAIALVVLSCFIAASSTSTMMTNTALFVEAELGWGQLEFGFIMMGAGAFGIFIQAVLFGPMTKRLGVMGLPILGSVVLAVGQFGIAAVTAIDDHDTRAAAFIVAQALFTFGMMVNMAITSPALAELAASDVLGRVVSLGAVATSAARIIAPTFFGIAFESSPSLPYIIAGAMAVAATASWVVTWCLVSVDSEQRARDATREAKQSQAFAQAIEVLQEELKAVLITRGYTLDTKESVEALVKIIDSAFPEKGDEADEAALLSTQLEFMRVRAFNRDIHNGAVVGLSSH